jgi:peptide-methionine (S)-S-oxide reductase
VGGGRTDHAEAVLVYYDPQVVSYAELLNVFFASHDPTTPNRQGPTPGRSTAPLPFTKRPPRKREAERAKSALETAKTFKRPIVSEIKPLTAFYRAEGYHQDYTRHHPDDGYVRQGVRAPVRTVQTHLPRPLKSAQAH